MTKKELRERIIRLKMMVVYQPELKPELISLQAEMSKMRKTSRIQSAYRILQKQKLERVVAENHINYGSGMTLEQIKAAVDAGKKVHWASESYLVVKSKDDYVIQFQFGSMSCIGLTWADGVTMNGKESEFFLGE